MAIPTPTEFWKLNDSKTGENGATLAPYGGGGDQFVTGKIGNCWSINNVVNQVLYSATPTIDQSASFSLSFWFKFTRTVSGLFSIALFHLVNSSTGYGVKVTASDEGAGDMLEVWWRTGYIGWNAGSWFDNNWHHFCLSVGASESILYIDRTQRGAYGAGTYSAVTPNKIVLGARWTTLPVDPADLIDAVGWWNIALTETQVSQLYSGNSGWEPSEDTDLPEPVEFWTLNDTRVGAVGGTVVASADAQDHYVTGNIGNGWEVALDTQRVLYGSCPLINPGDSAWSVSFWTYLRYLEDDIADYIIGLRDGVTSRIRLLNMYSPYLAPGDIYGGTIVYIGSTNVGTAAWNGIIQTLGWHHILLTHTPGTSSIYNLYADGQYADTFLTSTKVLNASNPIFWMGGHATGNPSDKIDAIGWWDQTLTEYHAQDLYNSGAGWEYTSSAIFSIDGTNIVRNGGIYLGLQHGYVKQSSAEIDSSSTEIDDVIASRLQNYDYYDGDR